MKQKRWRISLTALTMAAALWMTPEASGQSLALSVRPRFNPVDDLEVNPYDRQVGEMIERLKSPHADVRAGAAEALGFMRAYTTADLLVKALGDDSSIVRRQAVMSLAWCGGRPHVGALIGSLDDEDWTVRQAAWVSLTNLTGMEFGFDGLAKASVRSEQIKLWRRWWSKVPDGIIPNDVAALVRSTDREAVLRGLRALGSLGGEGATEMIIEVIAPHRSRDYNKIDNLDKHIVQAGLHSLGRLSDPEGFDVLISFLDTIGWVRFAADALGDFGDADAVTHLMATYPRFAKDLNRRLAKVFPEDDRARLGWNPEDRMYETPYAIALALSRLPLADSIDNTAAEQICVLLLANIPSDWDGGMLYEPEAFESVTAYLLERFGLRRAAIEAAFRAAPRKWKPNKYDAPEVGELTTDECLELLAMGMFQDVPFCAQWFPALCRDKQDVPRLIKLLDHSSGWIRINAAKALMFMGDKRAVEPIAKLLEESEPDAEYGFSGALEHAEYDNPMPRWREAFARALGRLGAADRVGILVKILEDERNCLDVQYAAALALDELGTSKALAALKRADAEHPFHTVRLVAREALWRRKIAQQERTGSTSVRRQSISAPNRDSRTPEAIVFIKGKNKMRTDFNLQSGLDPWRQTYTVTNSGPTMRVGQNLHIVRLGERGSRVTQLTHFKSGFVADCEVSWDAKKVIFARRLNGDERHAGKVKYVEASLRDKDRPLFGGADDPWWRIWEINIDGSGLRQLTYGPYHDVQPAYLGDGRIVFSSTRIGMRDEYHGYPCTGLAVMNSDGSDIHCIGFNLGGDREPAVMDDGRIIFSRLDLFYSRLKTEFTIQAVFPDGTKNVTLYGPERRDLWYKMSQKSKINGWSESPPRHRVLRLTQPQQYDGSRFVCSSPAGLVLIGPGRHREQMIPHDPAMAVTCPFPLGGEKVLCAATIKEFKVDGKVVRYATEQFNRIKGKVELKSAVNVDLGLYIMDALTGKMTLIYNDPQAADFEARPVVARRPPPVLDEGELTRKDQYTAELFCNSARISQTARVRTRGRLVRIIEGIPIVSRHESQQNKGGHLWRNHGGTHARVLGTFPLAADGSFYAEVPADRLLHVQVLDSDRRVVGNQLIWVYARPGEKRSCIGCHEKRDTTTLPNHFAQAARILPVKCLPSGDEFTYRAKAWLKGTLPDEAEERARVVRAVNLMGRY
ncbi:MAG: HEAT repeat domain-containing protein [Planctomycetota bacterium]|jgi:HEAT repeat protein